MCSFYYLPPMYIFKQNHCKVKWLNDELVGYPAVFSACLPFPGVPTWLKTRRWQSMLDLTHARLVDIGYYPFSSFQLFANQQFEQWSIKEAFIKEAFMIWSVSFVILCLQDIAFDTQENCYTTKFCFHEHFLTFLPYYSPDIFLTLVPG